MQTADSTVTLLVARREHYGARVVSHNTFCNLQGLSLGATLPVYHDCGLFNFDMEVVSAGAWTQVHDLLEHWLFLLLTHLKLIIR